MTATRSSYANEGWTDDGMNEYVSGVHCLTCGRFVGRDGYVSIGYFEMSNEIAYVEGECARCIALPVVEEATT